MPLTIDPEIELTAEGWRGNTSQRGERLFIRGEIGSVDDSAGAFLLESTIEERIKLLKRSKGFYAFVWKSGDQLIAVVDHVRSIPLFYGICEDKIFLSDSAEWVRKQIDDKMIDPQARAEYQLTGYVTGADTLFPNVKQLQAGECLIAETTDNGLSIFFERYYRFIRKEPDSFDESELNEALDEASVAAIQRLIDYADGRQIVVPLSGGYDSRLIAILLKRLEYPNILTFTYGTSDSIEAEYSRRVARALGLAWEAVTYSPDNWREVWKTDERWTYQLSASGLSSVPHLQDWLAVMRLKEDGLIHDDCVFAPGHTGDFISGGHLPEEIFSVSHPSLKDVGTAILRKHYDQAPLSTFDIPPDVWRKRIEDLLDYPTITTAVDFASAYETWEWQERQAKFIVNTVRVYEFFGYDWWLPLWDKAYVEFWEEVPLVLRKNRTWYIDYVNQQYARYVTDSQPQVSGNAAASNAMRIHAGSLAKRILPGFLRTYLWQKKQLCDLKRHPYAVYGRFDEKEIVRYTRKGYLLNGISAAIFLKALEKRLRNQ